MLLPLPLLLLLAAPAQAQATNGQPCFHKELSVPGTCKALNLCPRVFKEVKTKDPEYSCEPRFNPGSYLPNICCPNEAAGNSEGSGSVTLPPDNHSETGNRNEEQKPSKLSCEEYLANKETYEELPEESSTPGVKAMQKCHEYVEYVCSEGPSPLLLVNSSSITDRCFLQLELISGGQAAERNEFPHMALLGYGQRSNIEFSCGGSLIAPNFVLSAAHCRYFRRTEVGWVQLGMLYRGEDSAQLLRVKDVIAHPDYKAPELYNDLLLLRLERPARLGEEVRPACLNTRPDSEIIGRSAIVTGWGTLEHEEEEGSDVLMKVALRVNPLARCSQKGYSSKLPRGLQTTQLCAGGGSPKDSCQGDSGGPLQFNSVEGAYCMYRLIGVVSFGPPCGKGLPGVYTKVLPYLDWIEGIVWPSQ